MHKQKTYFRSTISRAILVLGVIYMSPTWLPNQAGADGHEIVGDQYGHAKINQLKSFGWKVNANETADGKVTFTATKSDPKTGETTQAKYVYTGPDYTSSVEHLFKDGSKTSEQSRGNEDAVDNRGRVIEPAHQHIVSSSTTDPSGNKTTKTYNNSGSKVVNITQFDSRFNTTTSTDIATGNKIITTPNSTRVIGPTGKNISDIERGNDGTTTKWSFDANGNANGRVIKKPDGTTTKAQSVPGGGFVSVTTDSNGTVIDKHSCDKIANCANPTNNQNPQNLRAAKQQNLVGNKNLQGKNASANKLQAGQQASNKQHIRTDVLNQIQNKGINSDAAKQMGSKFQAVPKGQSPSEFSQGIKHQPQNNSTKEFKAISKSQNWNSSAGSQGTVKHQYQNFNAPAGGRLKKWNRK